MAYYPVCLELAGRACAVIGGGILAEEKVRGLLAAGAAVTMISPNLTVGLQDLATAGRIAHLPRSFHPGDLAGMFLAFVAGQDAATVEQVWGEARRAGVLLNTVDDVPHCDFIMPSVLRRGDLTIAISTSGKAPALAVRLREHLETVVGPEHARFLELAGAVREPLARRWPDFETRRALWYRLVDSDVLSLLRQGHEDAALARFEEILGVLPDVPASPPGGGSQGSGGPAQATGSGGDGEGGAHTKEPSRAAGPLAEVALP